MRINPVYEKELKTSVRGMKMAWMILGYNGLLALFGLFAFFVTFEYESRYGGTVDYASILQIYAIITAVEFGLVLFTVPALTAASIAGEREKQTLELLMTTKLKPLQIILGKLASSISLMILLAFSSLPVLAIVFTIGGITLEDFVEFMLLIIVTAIFIGSIGIFFSSLFKKTTSATVSTYGTLFVLGIGTIAVLWGIRLVTELKVNKIRLAKDIIQIPDVKNWLLILLINPAVTFFSMIEDQIGTGARLKSFFENFGTVPMVIQEQWFVISIGIQILISVILLLLSARLLNPLRKKCKRKEGL